MTPVETSFATLPRRFMNLPRGLGGALGGGDGGGAGGGGDGEGGGVRVPRTAFTMSAAAIPPMTYDVGTCGGRGGSNGDGGGKGRDGGGGRDGGELGGETKRHELLW